MLIISTTGPGLHCFLALPFPNVGMCDLFSLSGLILLISHSLFYFFAAPVVLSFPYGGGRSSLGSENPLRASNQHQNNSQLQDILFRNQRCIIENNIVLDKKG